ncbi:MAG: UDP-glucose 4-epimerase GalE [Jatrophihabitans sp.]|nr:MAG: UDP-glucose 4-epimerase GalE [Jatrophihabitans sp.]
MKILITGGAGFIGSTIASACLDAGHLPVVVDDLSTGVLPFVAGRVFYCGDIADPALLRRVLAEHPDIAATVHCAAHIVVPESVADPLRYYRNNVAKTVDLLQSLTDGGCRRVLFSSSASIYGRTADFGVDEDCPLEPASPYARTKAMMEQVLADTAATGRVAALSLRYFNPIGADPRLRTGLQIRRPSHALGRLLDAARDGTAFTITGTDWPTRDGSGLRDYIHVWDLARAHVRALERFDVVVPSGYRALNVGTGTGTTVRELVAAFEQVTGAGLPVREGPPRPGDVAGAYARVGRAQQALGWRAELSITDGIRDALAWLEVRDAVLGAGG